MHIRQHLPSNPPTHTHFQPCYSHLAQINSIGAVCLLSPQLTSRPCLPRCAAVYLRLRSKGFREWVSRIEGAHLLTWVLRGMLVVGCVQTNKDGGWASLAGGVLLAGVLRCAESEAAAKGVADLSRWEGMSGW